MQILINRILDSNPKIRQISLLYDRDHGQYAAIAYQGINKVIYDILVSVEDLHLFLNPFRITSIKGASYVLLRLDSGMVSLHRHVVGVPNGLIGHHIYPDNTMDNCRSSIQAVTRKEHSRTHRTLKIQKGASNDLK